MIKRGRLLLAELRDAIWLVPGVLMLCFVAAAVAFSLYDTPRIFPYRLTFGPQDVEAASAVLRTIASTLFQAALILFSITMMVFAFSGNQYGSRLLRHFMDERYNQFVLGYYGSLYTFCLILSMNAGRDDTIQLLQGADLAIILAIIGVFLLIFYIHHVALSIQAPQIIARVGHRLRDHIHKLPPISEPPPRTHEPESPPRLTIHTKRSGYLASINTKKLEKVAKKEDLFIRFLVRSGQFLHHRQAIAQLHSDKLPDSDRWTDLICSSLNLTKDTKELEDLEYEIRHLVDIALRGLAPSRIDHFSVTNAIDRLTDGIALAAEKDFSQVQQDQENEKRIVIPPFTFHSFVDQACTQIRQNCANDPNYLYVSLHLLEALTKLTDTIENRERASTVAHQARQIAWSLQQHLDKLSPEDREAAQERLTALQELPVPTS